MAKSRRLPPVHPGEILREDLMAPLGLSINGLARDLRVPVTRMSEIVNGRRFFYGGFTSGHGEHACATCHVFGDFDNLAWDLGDPTGNMDPPPPGMLDPLLEGFHPMKGPMTTQSLRGLPNTFRFHWRADRANLAAFNPAFGVVDGDVVWVADWSAPQVTRLHAVGRARPRRISLPTGNPLVGVEDIAGGAGAVWATMPGAGELWRIDPQTSTVTRVRLPYLPTGVTTDADDVWVTVRKR